MNNKKIAVIGLGYVGLPLAVEFAKKREVIGFDINKDRISDLKKGIDITGELNKQELKESLSITYTTNLDDLKECTIFIINWFIIKLCEPLYILNGSNTNSPILALIFSTTLFITILFFQKIESSNILPSLLNLSSSTIRYRFSS